MNRVNLTKHIWIFLSAYGVFFAILSWGQEIITQGFIWKGLGALLFGFVLYRLVVHRI